MPRPPLTLNTYGKISRTPHAIVNEKPVGPWTARARYRDSDGVTREVAATRPTGAGAERALVDRLKGRAGIAQVGHLTPLSTVKKLTEVYLAKRTQDCQPSTVAGYKSVIDTHIVPRIGAVRIGEIRPSQLEHLMETLIADAEVGRSGPARVRRVLSGMCAVAVLQDAMTSNPVHSLTRLSRSGARPIRMSVDQIMDLRACLIEYETRPKYVTDKNGNPVLRTTGTSNGSRPKPGEPMKRSGPPTVNSPVDFLDLMLATGCRIGEVLALTHGECLLEGDAPSVTITSSIATRGPAVRQQPKTDSSHRVLTVPGFAVGTIKALRDKNVATEDPDDDLLFRTRVGTPVSANNMRRSWRTYLEGTEFEGLTPHKIRAVVATAIDDDVDLKTASQQLGHSSTEVTKRHYVAGRAKAPDVRAVLDRFAPKGFDITPR